VKTSLIGSGKLSMMQYPHSRKIGVGPIKHAPLQTFQPVYILFYSAIVLRGDQPRLHSIVILPQFADERWQFQDTGL
jgi:hypothetical protein